MSDPMWESDRTLIKSRDSLPLAPIPLNTRLCSRTVRVRVRLRCDVWLMFLTPGLGFGFEIKFA